MAKYELPIYGANDETLKVYETNHIFWGTYIEAADLQEQMQDKSAKDQMLSVNNLLKSIFVGLTDEELNKADITDVMNIFEQVVQGGQQIKSGNSKNA